MVNEVIGAIAKPDKDSVCFRITENPERKNHATHSAQNC